MSNPEPTLCSVTFRGAGSAGLNDARALRDHNEKLGSSSFPNLRCDSGDARGRSIPCLLADSGISSSSRLDGMGAPACLPAARRSECGLDLET